MKIKEIFCGEGGIRTPGEVAPTKVFKTFALDRYATSPNEMRTWLHKVLAEASVLVRPLLVTSYFLIKFGRRRQDLNLREPV